MTVKGQAAAVMTLMLTGAFVLSGLIARTSVVDRDAIRYIGQARRLADGDWRGGVGGSIDHPLYPALIASAHAVVGGDRPEDWQRTAQFVSLACAIFAVVPVFLVARQLFGAPAGLLGASLLFLLPGFARTFADGLSESTFFLAWSWGLWFALRYVGSGHPAWLLGLVPATGAAFLVRPEGLLLALATLATLVLSAIRPATRLPRKLWWAGIGLLAIGPASVAIPYMVAKGKIGTKPAIERLLGTSGPSPSHAVERKRPLDPADGALRTLGVAVKEVVEAAEGLVPLPVALLAAVGLGAAYPRWRRSREAIFVAVLLGAAALGLLRLYATGGYCQPRHTLIPSSFLALAAAFGGTWILGKLLAPRWPRLATASPLLLAGLALIAAVPAWQHPLHDEHRGYREAAAFLADRANADDVAVDVFGLSLFYAGREGVTFANLDRVFPDSGHPSPRWVIARRAHMEGPWKYCEILRWLRGDLAPVASFPADPRPGQSQVVVYDRFPSRGPGTPDRVALKKPGASAGSEWKEAD